jgi:cell division protein FtsQ
MARRDSFAVAARVPSFGPALSLAARLPSVRPALSLPALRRPTRRELVAAVAVAAAFVLAYVAARETSLFAVREVEVTGAPPDVVGEVRTVLEGKVGESLVSLDAAELEQRLRRLPMVRSATVDRAFPRELVVVVAAERPLAVVREGARAWVVAASGRVVREIEPNGRPRLPRIRARVSEDVRPGDTLAGPDVRAGLELLRAMPERFPARILVVDAGDSGVDAVVSGWLEVRLGPPVDLRAKLVAAGAVLRSLSPEERAAVEYLDASLPGRVSWRGAG